jgi:NAD-dependent deacetylase
MSDAPTDILADLKDLIAESKRAVIFTGAGISTESGIPDFRSPGGIWTKNQPIYFQDFMASEEARRETWRRKIETDKVMLQAKPNMGHLAIAKLMHRGTVQQLITQNIDGLHQMGGAPAERVIELHGNATYAACISCGLRYEIEPIKLAFTTNGTLPVCDCGGPVKTATISFGQQMPEEPMRRATEASGTCDLFIAVGSSLVVFPAAGFPLIAKDAGAKLVIINRDPTEQDRFADLVINAEIGPTLSRVVPLD